MLGAVSGLNASYNTIGLYRFAGADRTGQAWGAQQAEGLWTARRSAAPDTPVEPVRPVSPVREEEARPVTAGLPTLREGADPAEMAVRMRIKPYEEGAPEGAKSPDGNELKVGAEGAQAAMEEGKCQTCEKRKYQDESDDMGVSFQTPTSIAPEQVAAAVRGHENEHVVREQAKARMEDRKVVSQSVTLHTDICPECGKVYVSGGTTRTVTAAENNPAEEAEKADQASQEKKAFSVFG